jgi:hypothetical protein
MQFIGAIAGTGSNRFWMYSEDIETKNMTVYSLYDKNYSTTFRDLVTPYFFHLMKERMYRKHKMNGFLM